MVINVDQPGFCRDCLAPAPASVGMRCGECASPKLLRHPELDRLTIAHIDCDAFYAAIEKRDNPHLASQPVIVGGGRRGVVATACYIARIHGVRSAMPMFKALAACPDAVVVRPNMAKYVAVGRQVRDLMRELTPLVEPLSIDEAFLDLAGTERLHGRYPAQSLADFAMRIESEIGITVSIGLSHNKFLAKVASDLDKPRGFAVIGRADTDQFLADKPIGIIWGVGQSLQRRLAADGLCRIKDLRAAGETVLSARYGVIGRRLHELSTGHDDRSVSPTRKTKSISSESTFDTDIAELALLEARLWRLCEKVSTRAKAAGLAGLAATLKLKTDRFRVLTRNTRLSEPSQLADTLFKAARPLLAREAIGQAYRLIGIGLSDLSPAIDNAADDLFAGETQKHARVEAAIDAVRARFGTGAVDKGRALNAMTSSSRTQAKSDIRGS